MAQPKRYSLYVKDKEAFKKLKDELRTLYYKKYGNSLSVGDILTFALTTTKNALKCDSFTVEGQEKHDNIVDQYSRIE